MVMVHADLSLHYVLEDLLAAMGVHGLFNDITPKFVVEFKTPWAFRFEDLLTHWDQHKNNNGDKVVKAIAQLYGYMTFNVLRYGAFTTCTKTWFFKRIYEQAGSGRLEVAGPYDEQDSAALLTAYLAVLLEVDEDWLYVSPSAIPSRPSRGQLQARQLDLGATIDITAISFGQGRARSRIGCVGKEPS
uniref:Fungal-type protein kinase domain-containing protein n=1 Tax=Peronospora matthiolae TaxID=2874970 RepID=A0AAV1T348_9STRA